jgi:hypothetical protein
MNLQADDAALAQAAAEIPRDQQLGEVQSLVRELIQATINVQRIEEMLARANAELRDVAERKLPDRLTALGLTGVPLISGAAIEVKSFVSVSIPRDNQPTAFSWLESIGAGDLIKNTITTTFGRGEDELASGVYRDLVSRGYPVDQKRNVAPQTLKAFIKRRIEAGEPVPAESGLSIYAGQKAELVLPKDGSAETLLAALRVTAGENM